MDYYTYSSGSPSTSSLIIKLLILILMIVSQWKIFTKAGRPGWASIIPIYNLYVLFEIAGMEGWNIIFLLIPLVNLYFAIKVYIKLSQAFGHGTGFGLGLVFLTPIFMPILAFGSSQYTGE